MSKNAKDDYESWNHEIELFCSTVAGAMDICISAAMNKINTKMTPHKMHSKLRK